MTGVATPDGWQQVVDFVEAPRGSYKEIRDARSHCSPVRGKELLMQYVENSKAANMLIHNGYIKAIM